MYLKKMISEEDFISRFEFNREQNEVFLKMENGFQNYVYDKCGHYIYQYKKPAFMNDMRCWI